MADFFGREDEQETVDSIAESQPETITLGGKEYSLEEAEKFVSKGMEAAQFEDKYSTSVEGAWRSHGNQARKIKELEDQINQYESQRTSQTNNQVTDASIEEAREAARKLGIVLKDDLPNLGVVTEKTFVQKYMEQKAADDLLSQARRLESEIDGSDGRPAFRVEDVLTYMEDTGIASPEKAYKLKYESEIDAWKEGKIQQAKKPGLVTGVKSTAGATKQPKEPKVTRDNLEALVKEQLYGAE